MVGIVIVSHSQKLADGVVDLTKIMADGCPIAAAGGMDNGGFGTSYEKIMLAIEEVHGPDGAIILMDMGSAVMTTEMVLEDLGYEDVKMVDCPIAEGNIILAEYSIIPTFPFQVIYRKKYDKPVPTFTKNGHFGPVPD